MNDAAAKLQVPDQCSTPVRHREADHARQVRGTMVVVVETEVGKYRRRAFLTLASAQRAVERAEAAGHRASIVLARLEPVAVIG